ncbi:MAG: SRPBCC family protein [Chloroflexi bacterium]|nr:SRPBCC family protein [Chloroflexota bacterium]
MQQYPETSLTNNPAGANPAGTMSPVNVSKTERDLSTFAGTAFLVLALMRPRRLAALLGPVGLYMLYQGVTGHSPIYALLGLNRAVHEEGAAISVPHQQGLRVVHSVTIARPVAEIYAFWRDFTNLPQFMRHLESVTSLGEGRSRWKVKGPVGTTIEWDAVLVNDEVNRVIGWRTLENPTVDHAGSVRFKPATGDRGTEVTVELEYHPVGGALGAAFATLLGVSPDRQIWEDLQRLKQHLEVGQTTSVEGQTSGRAESNGAP